MYIGLSENIEKRYREHANGHHIKNSRIDRAIRKYGADKFDLEIIEKLPNDRTLLMKREEYWVSHYNTYQDKNHYNLTPGGDFNPMKDPNIKEKHAQIMKSGEVRDKLSEANSGRKLSQETKEKISKANSGKNHPFFGHKHTPETIQKMSEANSGRNVSQKTRNKLSKALSGRELSDEHKINVSKSLNTSGYYRVYKKDKKDSKQGFTWVYKYQKDGNRKEISSVDIKKLEEKVRAKGLKWLKFD